MRSEEVGLLSIGRNVIEVKCFLLERPDPVWKVTVDVFWYEGKGSLEIALYSYWKEPLTVEVNSWYRAEVQTCIFSRIALCMAICMKTMKYFDLPYAAATGDSFIFMHDNTRPHTARLVETMLETETIHLM